MPLSIFLSDKRVITVAPHAADFADRVLEQDVRELPSETRTRFILRLMWQVAAEYLNDLEDINAKVDALENALQRSLRNKEVLGLLKYEKSLVYFTTALRSNELVLERMQRGNLLDWSQIDKDFLGDVMIEVRQAIETVAITRDILSQMMDAFASIVSNNLNVVMKLLTSATIIVAIPTLLASLYGMNVSLPGAHSPLAFGWILTASALLAVTMVIVFRRKHWL